MSIMKDYLPKRKKKKKRTCDSLNNNGHMGGKTVMIVETFESDKGSFRKRREAKFS